jgi:hypothetical protein
MEPDGYLRLQINGEAIDFDDCDPDCFLHKWSGSVVLHPQDGDNVKIGDFEVMYVDAAGAYIQGVRVDDVFDSDYSVNQYCSALYDRQFDFRKSVLRAVSSDGPLENPNLLVLDRLVIYPEYRGHDLGLTVLRGLIHRFRLGAGLIAMRPFPLQGTAHFLNRANAKERTRLGLDKFPADQKVATNNLRCHYEKLGFRRVAKTEYMVLDASLPI